MYTLLIILLYGFNECERIYQTDLALLILIHIEATAPALW